MLDDLDCCNGFRDKLRHLLNNSNDNISYHNEYNNSLDDMWDKVKRIINNLSDFIIG